VLVLLSRTIGGLRAGDLNALDWTAFGPDFATCTLVRRKTRKKKPAPTTFEVPSLVRPFLVAWHERHDFPITGPVFPVRRGPRAGEAKKRSNMSYADRLRRELTKAGISRYELHNETSTTRPVDFHSTRRAYSQALGRANVNEQTAMLLTGHADSKTHRRYLESVAVRQLPEAAVPPICIAHADSLLRKSPNYGAGHEIRTRDPKLGKLKNCTAGARRILGIEPFLAGSRWALDVTM
jgi:integrase